MPNLTALVTLAALLFFVALTIPVAQARKKTHIAAPAMTGHPDLERALRVHANTLEWMPVFLPALWLAAIYVNDALAAITGLGWIVGRVLYARGYLEAAEKREMGFTIQASAAGLLWLVALFGILKAII